jgi:amino acid permease
MSHAITKELKSHAPFTLLGAVSGILVMAGILLIKISSTALEPAFEASHAAHVFLSAMVTAGVYRRHGGKPAACLLMGYVGAVSIGTLSDIVFPYLGGELLGADMHFHLAFIDHWWLINPAALVGAALALLSPRTKLPHSGHVLLSTWASLFYLNANAAAPWSLPMLIPVLAVLFVAVWVPCCLSDIAFLGCHVHHEH